MEQLFLLLITTKSSNIVDDLQTLQLLFRLVKRECEIGGGLLNEHMIMERSFEILFAFDEVVSMGFSDTSLSADQVAGFLEMYSQEENLHELIMQGREEDAIRRGKSEAAAIAKRKAREFAGGAGSGMGGGLSSSGGIAGGGIAGGGSGYSFTSSNEYGRDGGAGTGQQQQQQSRVGSMRGFGPGSASSPSSASSSSRPSGSSFSSSTAAPKKAPVSQSIKTKTTAKKTGAAGKELLNDLIKSGDVHASSEDAASTGADVSGSDAGTAGSAGVHMESVHVKIEETVNAELNREGGLSKLDVKGEMFVTIADADKATLRIKLTDALDEGAFQSKTHPNIDKQLFTSEATLALKNQKKPFPTKTNLRILTWKLKDVQEQFLPLTVSCWPSPSTSGMTVNVEYELTRPQMQLTNVVIAIPVPNVNNVRVEPMDVGSFKLDHENGQLLWIIDTMSQSSSSGNLEFNISGAKDESSFFPVSVQFTSQDSISGVSTCSVENTIEESDAIAYSTEVVCRAGEYLVV